MGFWCGTKTSTEASAWTHEHGMWDTSVSSTTTDPCTETQARNTDSITLTVFITHKHWKHKSMGNKYYYQVILPTLHQFVLTTICMVFNDKLFIMSPRSSYFFYCESFIMDWYQRCLRREFWLWGVCSSFSTEIFPSADLLLSSESLPARKTAASLPLRVQERSNLRTTFGTHKTKTSESFSMESSDQQNPSGVAWVRVHADLVFQISYFRNESSYTMTLTCSRKVQIPFQWKDQEISADNVLPPCGSGA